MARAELNIYPNQDSNRIVFAHLDNAPPVLETWADEVIVNHGTEYHIDRGIRKYGTRNYKSRVREYGSVACIPPTPVVVRDHPLIVSMTKENGGIDLRVSQSDSTKIDGAVNIRLHEGRVGLSQKYQSTYDGPRFFDEIKEDPDMWVTDVLVSLDEALQKTA